MKSQDIYQLYKTMTNEDSVISASDKKDQAVLAALPEADKDIAEEGEALGGLMTSDVLGNYNPDNGILGPNDFNVPTKVYKKVLKRYELSCEN